MTSTVAAVSQTQSLAAIRNFVRTSVSWIAYSRGLCSDDTFEERVFLGLTLPHMVPKTEEAVALSEWVEKGAFDALNKNYLKEMSLCVYNADCSDLLESYCFGFSYSPDGRRAQMTMNASAVGEAAMTSSDGGSTQLRHRGGGSAAVATAGGRRPRRCSKLEVQQMLCAIVTKLVSVMEQMPPLLSHRVVALRLTYDDAVTPPGYDPPFFSPASEHMVQLYRREQQYSVSLGSMDTGHHFFSVSIRHPVLARVDAARRATRMTESGRTQQTAANASLVSDTTEHPDEEAAAAKALVLPVKGVADPSCLRPADAELMPTVSDVLSRDTTTAGAPFSVRELGFLLVVSYVFTKAPAAPGGRGRFTLVELEDHLRDGCAMDVTLPAALSVLVRLAQLEGFLLPQAGATPLRGTRPSAGDPGAAAAASFQSDGSSRVAPAAVTDSALPPPLQPKEWILAGDPPLAVVRALLGQQALVQLLLPRDAEVLRRLADALAARKPKGRKQPRHSGSKTQKRAKM